MTEQWCRVIRSEALDAADVARFDHADSTYAVFRDEAGRLAATAGLCTHARVHLADGFVFGTQIECPKHNGRFNVETGDAIARPVTVGVRSYPCRINDGKVEIQR